MAVLLLARLALEDVEPLLDERVPRAAPITGGPGAREREISIAVVHDTAGGVDLVQPFDADARCFDIVRGLVQVLDRKSTRLNSSH